LGLQQNLSQLLFSRNWKNKNIDGNKIYFPQFLSKSKIIYGIVCFPCTIIYFAPLSLTQTFSQISDNSKMQRILKTLDINLIYCLLVAHFKYLKAPSKNHQQPHLLHMQTRFQLFATIWSPPTSLNSQQRLFQSVHKKDDNNRFSKSHTWKKRCTHIARAC
jgi:hypothetical protein